jgi:hypothetical protein
VGATVAAGVAAGVAAILWTVTMADDCVTCLDADNAFCPATNHCTAFPATCASTCQFPGGCVTADPPTPPREQCPVRNASCRLCTDHKAPGGGKRAWCDIDHKCYPSRAWCGVWCESARGKQDGHCFESDCDEGIPSCECVDDKEGYFCLLVGKTENAGACYSTREECAAKCYGPGGSGPGSPGRCLSKTSRMRKLGQTACYGPRTSAAVFDEYDASDDKDRTRLEWCPTTAQAFRMVDDGSGYISQTTLCDLNCDFRCTLVREIQDCLYNQTCHDCLQHTGCCTMSGKYCDPLHCAWNPANGACNDRGACSALFGEQACVSDAGQCAELEPMVPDAQCKSCPDAWCPIEVTETEVLGVCMSAEQAHEQQRCSFKPYTPSDSGTFCNGTLGTCPRKLAQEECVVGRGTYLDVDGWPDASRCFYTNMQCASAKRVLAGSGPRGPDRSVCNQTRPRQ